MKVFYRKLLEQIDDLLVEAQQQHKVIDYIELDRLEWNQLIAENEAIMRTDANAKPVLPSDSSYVWKSVTLYNGQKE